MSTGWEQQLARRAAAVNAARRDVSARKALEADIASARLDGHSFGDIGVWAGVGDEAARAIATRINNTPQTRAEVTTWQRAEDGAGSVRPDEEPTS